jgi:hypothetical protein
MVAWEAAELFRQVPDHDPAVPIPDLKDVSVALGSAQVHPGRLCQIP